MYRRLLSMGCRCVEIDVHDPADKASDEPEVFHAFCPPTNKLRVKFGAVLEAINDAAFPGGKSAGGGRASAYPIVLSLEVHCNVKRQGKMARLLLSVFGRKLALPPEAMFVEDAGGLRVERRGEADGLGDELGTESPASLRGRIIVKGKHATLRADLRDVELCVRDDDGHNSESEESDDNGAGSESSMVGEASEVRPSSPLSPRPLGLERARSAPSFESSLSAMSVAWSIAEGSEREGSTREGASARGREGGEAAPSVAETSAATIAPAEAPRWSPGRSPPLGPRTAARSPRGSKESTGAGERAEGTSTGLAALGSLSGLRPADRPARRSKEPQRRSKEAEDTTSDGALDEGSFGRLTRSLRRAASATRMASVLSAGSAADSDFSRDSSGRNSADADAADSRPSRGKRALAYSAYPKGIRSSDGKVSEELSLVTAMEAVKFGSFRPGPSADKRLTVSSFKEGKAAKLEAKSAAEWRVHNGAAFSRVYPRGSRYDSSNFSEALACRIWSAGCQMVALNWQTWDSTMLINQARFSLNNGCGYVLRPPPLPVAPPPDAPPRGSGALGGTPAPAAAGGGARAVVLSLRILSAFNLPKTQSERLVPEVWDEHPGKRHARAPSPSLDYHIRPAPSQPG